MYSVLKNARGRLETHDPEVQLEICKSFHRHLMKYLVMICNGHVPVVGVGKHPHRINRDIEPFIRYFLPKGQKLGMVLAGKIVKFFHLAFKGMDTAEVYDVLMGLLVDAINKYDPGYTVKVRQVVGVIQNELSQQKQFRLADINRHLEFDGNRYLRLLCRTGFLEFFQGEATLRSSGYQRAETWPPSAELRKDSKSLAAAFDNSRSGATNPLTDYKGATCQTVHPPVVHNR